MKIAFVTPGFSADETDWCIPILQNLARSLSGAHQVIVYTISYPNHSGDYEVKGVPVRSFGDRRTGRLANVARLYRTLEAIGREHCRQPFMAVHGFWADSGGVVAALAGRRFGIRSILTVMGGELIHEARAGYGKSRRLVAGNLARMAARRATTVNVSSEYHRKRILAGTSRIDPVVVPLGTDTGLFHDRVPPQPLAGNPAILCVGSLVTVKGHRYLLDALACVAPSVPDFHLHVVGRGPLETELRGQVAALGLGLQVSFHGQVEHHELPAWYRGAHFCVLGSLFENHGMTILEAAACGRLTVGSPVGLMPELCPPHLLADPTSTAEWARVLACAAEDQAARRTFECRLPQLVREKYSLEVTRMAFESLYRPVRV
jgi:glycosyltransferase involved in cell wall biosynthesis